MSLALLHVLFSPTARLKKILVNKSFIATDSESAYSYRIFQEVEGYGGEANSVLVIVRSRNDII